MDADKTAVEDSGARSSGGRAIGKTARGQGRTVAAWLDGHPLFTCFSPEERKSLTGQSVPVDDLPVFKSFSPEEKRSWVDQDLPIFHFAAGQTVIHKGDTHRILYLLLYGSLLVTRAGIPAPLARLSPGAFFGEMAFLCPIPRQTNVVADQPSLLVAIDRPAFEAMECSVRDKIKDQLFTILVNRMAEMNKSMIEIIQITSKMIRY